MTKLIEQAVSEFNATGDVSALLVARIKKHLAKHPMAACLLAPAESDLLCVIGAL